MAQQIDWKATEQKARKMSDAGLHYARLDCRATAEAMGTGPMFGKDAAAEQRRRRHS